MPISLNSHICRLSSEQRTYREVKAPTKIFHNPCYLMNFYDLYLVFLSSINGCSMGDGPFCTSSRDHEFVINNFGHRANAASLIST